MTVQIVDVFDRERICGWRKSCGIYLVGSADMRECGKLPFPLNECLCCGQRVKLTRGLQRVSVPKLSQEAECQNPSDGCKLCLINRTQDAYLIGVGHKPYKTKDSWLREAMDQGISKRIGNNQIPHGFKVGESVVLIGYPKVFTDYVPEGAVNEPKEFDDDAEQKGLPDFQFESKTTGRMVAKDIPGVIALFRPARIEYVTSGNESEEYLEKLVERGITPVRIHRVVDEQLSLEHGGK